MVYVSLVYIDWSFLYKINDTDFVCDSLNNAMYYEIYKYVRQTKLY